MKKCLGCGIELQTDNDKQLGYTPKIENDLCMRCFKLKHYGQMISAGKNQNNEDILKQIDLKKGHVLFLVDFLNISEEAITMYKKIKSFKTLVITKSDLIPKNIKKDQLLKNIKKIYSIEEDVLLISSKNKENISEINRILEKHKRLVLVGFTNAGKSSLINALTGSDITVSSKENTTQEFILLRKDNCDIYDAPGFISNNQYNTVVKEKIKPKTYQLVTKHYLKLLDIDIASLIDNNLTLYIDNSLRVERRRIKEDLTYKVDIDANSDLVIKGIGFIKFSIASKISINISDEYYEIRPSIIGGGL